MILLLSTIISTIAKNVAIILACIDEQVKNFENSLDTLVNDKDLNTEDGQVIDGFRLSFKNVNELRFNVEESTWSRDSIWTYNVQRYATFNVVGTQLPFDYRIIFYDTDIDSTIDLCMRYLPNSSNC